MKLVRSPTVNKASLAVVMAPDEELETALTALQLSQYGRVVTLLGSAYFEPEIDVERVRALIYHGLRFIIDKHSTLVVDGGTNVGICAIAGDVRRALGGRFPLLGVAPSGMIRLKVEADVSSQKYDLEPNHSHFLIITGDKFGAESRTLVNIPTVLNAPSLVFVVGGGALTRHEVMMQMRLDDNPSIIVIEGTGRFADAIATAKGACESRDRELESLAKLPNVHVFSIGAPIESFISLLNEVVE